MFATNLSVLTKLASMFNVAPERDGWNPDKFTGTIKALNGRLEIHVYPKHVNVSECSDNGHGYMLARRSAGVPSGLSFKQIVEWIHAWLDRKPALPDGSYRINSEGKVYSGPVLDDDRLAYLMSYANNALGAYPLGGSVEFRDGVLVGAWGSI